MIFRTSRLILVLLFVPGLSMGQIVVKITPPEFVRIAEVLTTGPSPAIKQAQLEAMLFGPLKTLEAQGAQRINGALDKPLAFQGLADAATLPLLSLGRSVWDSSRFSLTMGVWAGIQTDTLDFSALEKRFQTVRPDLDYRLGASILPLALAVSVTPFPGELSWSFGSFGAWSRVSYAPYSLTTWAAGGLLSARWSPIDAEWGGFGWRGIVLSGGGGWVQNRYETELKVALPTQTVTVDLSFFSEDVTIAANPIIGLSLNNRGSFWPLQLSTEFSFLRTLRLGLAGGVAWAHGWSSIGIHGTNPVSVTGGPLMSQILGSTATLAVDGDVTGEVGPWWQEFVGVTPSWAVGAWRIGFPLTWRFPGGLAGALAWGISL